jgi:toxin ParE1/3/4
VSATFTVELSPFVVEDLEAITDYLIGEGATDAARRLINAFQDRVDALETFPRRGNIPKELEGLQSSEVRQLVLPPYRIFFEIKGSNVLVLLPADGRRDLPALLAQRLIDSRKSDTP